MTRVIAFLGPAGAGKSTATEFLVEKYGAKRYSLAGPLKEIAKRVLNFRDEQLYGTQAQKEAVDERYGFSARWFLQRLGTEGCRAVMGDDIWTKTCLSQIKREAPDLAVIDDMRFINESEMLRFDPMLLGYVWRMCPPFDEEAHVREKMAGLHASEREWLVAPADIEIAPKQRGIPELLKLVDDAARVVMGRNHAYPLNTQEVIKKR